jgi:crotonobetainyl-CoA:carnitine CoA-transferase CaiB-like acyl-CoA transferase
VRLPPPLLGEHNDDVLSSWLGMTEKEINQLKEKKVI